MSMYLNGHREWYDEDLLAALEPEGELDRRRGQQGRRQSQGVRGAKTPRPVRQGLRQAQGERGPKGARKSGHPRGCSCARCRAGGHVAGCNCKRCKRARRVIGQYLGAESEQVRWVQSALNRVLKLRLSVDGVMSPAVRSAVREFQRREGLPEDGIVGPPTQAALARAVSAGPAAKNGSGPPALPASEPAPPTGEPAPPAGEPAAEGGEEKFIDELWGGMSYEAPQSARGVSVVNRMAHTPRAKRLRERDRGQVHALVLQQMTFSRGNNPAQYDNITAHFVITPDGKIVHLHPVTALLQASSGFNSHSVTVEFAGNFPNVNGKCLEPAGCDKLTPAQVKAGRDLIRHLIDSLRLTTVLAHRQANASRNNDPGPDIWYHVGQWAINRLGLHDGGRNFKVGDGEPIPDRWRTWGQVRPNPELEDEDFLGGVWGALKSAGSYLTGGSASAPSSIPTTPASSSGGSYAPAPPTSGGSYVPAPPTSGGSYAPTPPAGRSFPEIDALQLEPDVAEAARILKLKSPGVIFTSGRRDIYGQAHAMATNIVVSKDRKWIAAVYPSGAKLQQWVDAHPEATSIEAIAKGLEGVMKSMPQSELLRVSKHLSGRAFDIQPGSANEEHIHSLPGLKDFLKKEGNLVRWHLQF